MSRTKWIVAVVLIVTVAVGLANVAAAGKKKAKGIDLYKQYCKPCHEEDSEHGEYTPMALIQDQWERFFEEKFVASHSEVLDPNHDNKPVTEAISEEDLEKIRDFAVEHAADSEHPMTCG
jgi:hypothetical protein